MDRACDATEDRARCRPTMSVVRSRATPAHGAWRRWSVPDVVAVRPPARRRVGRLPHHQLPPEVAHLLAPLVQTFGLHGDDPAVGLRLRLDLVYDSRLCVDR